MVHRFRRLGYPDRYAANPMLTLCIKEFARTGEFGPIHLGVTRDALRSMIGDPDCWGGPDAKSLDTADIWKYGDIEFYLDASDLLYMIFADDFDVPNGGDASSIDPWIVRMYLDDATFKDELQSIGIEYTIATLPYLPGQIEIKTMGNVEFRFQIETEDEFDRLRLQGFCLRKNAA